VSPGSFVVLTIGDSGPGITAEIRDKIFDPYFTTKAVGKGTGMGLAIVHGIIKRYAGFITCETVLGKGTVFHVYFPAIEQVLSAPGEILENVQPGKERILFIDDEEFLVDLGKTVLERLGYEVTVRTSSMEAWNTFKNQPDRFDIVITDQTMPGVTGSDLALKMLQLRPNLPIILLTGYSSIISEKKAKSMGIKGFAMKPMVRKEIALLIRQVLDNKTAC
jgi:CheY-like chemotaxis protein